MEKTYTFDSDEFEKILAKQLDKAHKLGFKKGQLSAIEFLLDVLAEENARYLTSSNLITVRNAFRDSLNEEKNNG